MKNASLSRSAVRALLLSLALSGPVAFAQDAPVQQVSARSAATAQSATARTAANPEPAAANEQSTSTASTPRTINAAQTQILLDALKGKNWEVARAAIQAGADVNAADKGGVTPLMRAADAGQPQLVEMMVKNGANVNAVDKKGQTALHYAVPADPKPKKKFGFDKVMGVVSGGLGMLTGGLLGGNLISSLVGGGGVQSLLAGNLTSLLGGGAFNMSGTSGWSAIAGAALQGDASGNFGMGQLMSAGGMLGKNGQINALGASNWMGLLSSVKESNPQIIGAMRNLGAEGSPAQSALWGQFLTAASSGNEGEVAKLMKNPELSPLLQKATAGLGSAVSELPGNASRSIIDTLMQNGANANAVDKDGKTASNLARDRGLTDFFSSN